MSLIARRPRLIAVAAATAVAGLVLAGWTLAPRTEADGRVLGPRMAIDLVAPKEPELIDGGILEVGQINDGFDDAALERVATEDPTYLPEDAYVGSDGDFADLPRMPLPRPVAFDGPVSPEGASGADRDALDDGSRWFGLDRLLRRPSARHAGPDGRAQDGGLEWRRIERPEDAVDAGSVPYDAGADEYSSE